VKGGRRGADRRIGGAGSQGGLGGGDEGKPNSKIEIRNPKQILISDDGILKFEVDPRHRSEG